MKKYIFSLLFFMLLGCKSRLISSENEKPLFKTFNLNDWNGEYKNFKPGIRYNSYLYNRKSFSPNVYSDGIYVYIYPQKKQFYTIYNEYFSNLKQKAPIKFFGKIFGWDMFLQSEMKIGWWYEYDENGKIIKKTDEDTKFGAFGYNQLLKTLDENKIISFKKGVQYVDGGNWNIQIQFFYSPNSAKKLWKVTLQTESVNDRIVFEKNIFKPYYFDGNTGERIVRMIDKKEYYKEIGFSM